MDCCKTRKQLKDARDIHIRNYRQRLLSLRDNWQRLHTSHRVIIHLPSKGTYYMYIQWTMYMYMYMYVYMYKYSETSDTLYKGYSRKTYIQYTNKGQV